MKILLLRFNPSEKEAGAKHTSRVISLHVIPFTAVVTTVKIASHSVQTQQKGHEYMIFLCIVITVFPEYSHTLVQPFSTRYAIILMPFGLFYVHTLRISTLSVEMQTD